MKGVMSPGVSAGSNHVGANETCTPQVSCPCGVAANTRYGANVVAVAAAPAATRAARRVSPEALARSLRLSIGGFTCSALTTLARDYLSRGPASNLDHLCTIVL